ncbi:unnamed protein product [Protopolystoma xenopodis]|uniref:Uncharacterized protein n=1 Tax=Protopolystoma xenopodis TaxID=117903 RepID=A0A448X8G5_9PLAT|nr:unnamed protein product [Protopolystoma xenopodis]
MGGHRINGYFNLYDDEEHAQPEDDHAYSTGSSVVFGLDFTPFSSGNECPTNGDAHPSSFAPVISIEREGSSTLGGDTSVNGGSGGGVSSGGVGHFGHLMISDLTPAGALSSGFASGTSSTSEMSTYGSSAIGPGSGGVASLCGGLPSSTSTSSSVNGDGSRGGGCTSSLAG